jgi:TatD DNase family protein
MSTRYSTGFDAHTHLDFPAFDGDREQVCARARGAGVHDWIIAGADPRHWERVLTCAAETGGCPVLGIHPWWADGLDSASLEDLLEKLRTYVTSCGIGEIGLDFATAKTPPSQEQQQHVFRSQLALARELDLPVIIHCVRAYPALFSLLQSDGLPARGGMLHGWSAHVNLLQEALDLGLMVSVNSLITRSPKIAEAASQIPLTHLLLETDSPDQPLLPGQRSEPAHLIILAKRLAALRTESANMLLEAGRENGARLFGLGR